MKNVILLALFVTIFLSACETNEESKQDNHAPPPPIETSETATESTPASGIAFHEGTWAAALAKAKEENKLVFLDISASWCGPCKMLKKNTFSDQTVGDFYNSKFINVEVDGEVGEGIMLAQNYKIQGYPSLLFIKPDGSVVKETAGFLPPDQFIAYGKSVTK